VRALLRVYANAFRGRRRKQEGEAPIPTILGIHQRRLRKLGESVEQALKGGAAEPRLDLKEQYMARVLDILDLSKAAATPV
jgi:hypothetical protein